MTFELDGYTYQNGNPVRLPPLLNPTRADCLIFLANFQGAFGTCDCQTDIEQGEINLNLYALRGQYMLILNIDPHNKTKASEVLTSFTPDGKKEFVEVFGEMHDARCLITDFAMAEAVFLDLLEKREVNRKVLR